MGSSVQMFFLKSKPSGQGIKVAEVGGFESKHRQSPYFELILSHCISSFVHCIPTVATSMNQEEVTSTCYKH